MSAKNLSIATFLLASFTSFTVSVHADDETRREQLEFFEGKIRPVLVRECYQCHSTDSGKTKGGLLLDSRGALLRGGESGPAIVAGKPDDSLLMEALRHEDLEMPPRGKLSEDVIADFERWIGLGAPDPRVKKWTKPRPSVTSEDIEKAKAGVWAFGKPEKPARPSVKDKTWPRSEIDHHVLATLEKRGLRPVGDADPATLLRRMHFDLTGLPPTRREIVQFLEAIRENREAALKAKVDELLERPTYGERWGRHWLDVARYAESTGKSVNVTFPHAWRYRDYVIDSFNDDTPFDRFIEEQIAGDLLPSKSDKERQENLIATGFLSLGTKSLVERNPRQFRADLIDEQIDTTTQAFLGVTVSCARCHDHKFDPIPTTDYYALAGIFLSTDTFYGTAAAIQNRHATDLLTLPVEDETPAHRVYSREELDRMRQRVRELRREMFEIRRNRDTASQQSIIRTRSQIGQIQGRLKEIQPSGRPRTLAMGVRDGAVTLDAKLLLRGEVEKPTEAVPRGFVRVLYDGDGPEIASGTSGRRELAAWLSSRENPLTARVMVNRIWLHLFGEGLVSTPNNWGATGQPPSHPELVDHLAIRFMDSGWSVKSLIREIVLSRAYQLSSRFDAKSYEADPDNRYLWRANSRQLDAEALRDAILAVSGTLDLDRPLGSPVARIGNTRVGRTFDASLLADLGNRRSVYLPVLRGSLPRSLSLFDFADPSLTSAQRDSSNSPLQALYLMNNEFVLRRSRSMARGLEASSDQLSKQIRSAFLMAYGRAATDEEVRRSERFFDLFLARAQKKLDDRDRARQLALSAFCQSLFASAEFRCLD